MQGGKVAANPDLQQSMCFIDPKTIDLELYKYPSMMAKPKKKGPQERVSDDSIDTLVSGISGITGISGISKFKKTKNNKARVQVVEEETEDADEVYRREEIKDFDVKLF